MVRFPHWQVGGAAVIGTAHRCAVPPRGCDDVCAWRHLPERALAIAVADGAGSASHAAQGADAAVQAALDAVEQAAMAPLPASAQAWHEFLPKILTAAQLGVQSRVEAPFNVHDYATTLIVAIITTEWVAVVHVGDGASIIQESDGEIRVLTWPHNGVYINETVFIISPQAHKEAQMVVCPRGTINGLALLTDGIEPISLNMTHKVASTAFFQPLFAFVGQPATEEERNAQLAAFLATDRVNERTDDDKTLVLALEIVP